MTVTGAGASGYGTLSRLVGDSASIRQTLDTLNQQAATLRIADSYAGLGAGARTSLDLRPLIAHQKTWQDGIDAATGQMQVAQTAMTQIQQVASSLYAQLNNLNGLSAQTVDTLAASARQSLQQVAGLLDSKDGDNYVFGGQDTANPPVPDPDQITSSGFYADQRGGRRARRQRGPGDRVDARDRGLQCRRNVPVLRVPLAAGGLDPGGDRRDRRGAAFPDRAAGQRQQLRDLHRQFDNRLIHA